MLYIEIKKFIAILKLRVCKGKIDINMKHISSYFSLFYIYTVGFFVQL